MRIPENYIPSENLRLRTYKRISSIASEEEKQDVRRELADRFGAPPATVENLLEYAVLKSMCERLRISAVERQGNRIAIRFHAETPLDPATLVKVVRSRKGIKLDPSGVLWLETTRGESVPGRSEKRIARSSRPELNSIGEEPHAKSCNRGGALCRLAARGTAAAAAAVRLPRRRTLRPSRRSRSRMRRLPTSPPPFLPKPRPRRRLRFRSRKPAASENGGKVVEEIVARVNNEVITRSEFEHSKVTAEDDAKTDCQNRCTPEQLKTLTEDRQKNALRDLIDQSLLVQRGKDLGISVEPEVIKQLDQIRIENKLQSMEALEEAVSGRGTELGRFQEQYPQWSAHQESDQQRSRFAHQYQQG